jgi:hypothetical protein
MMKIKKEALPRSRILNVGVERLKDLAENSDSWKGHYEFVVI